MGTNKSKTPPPESVSQKPVSEQNNGAVEVEAVQNGEMKTLEQIEHEYVQQRKEVAFKYKSDDQIFAKEANFSPGKNVIVHEQDIPQTYFKEEEHPIYNPNLGNSPYS